MPKKKASKKRTKLKKTAAKKAIPIRKKVRKKPARKAAPKKHVEKRSPAPKKTFAKTKAAAKKKALVQTKAVGKAAAAAKPSDVSKKQVQRESRTFDTDAKAMQDRRSRSAGQSGDLQGLSGHEGADSEGVDELLEEGNAFEADVVSGVENADNADEKEVHTHEVPEDDVPGEYLDEE